MSGARTLLNGAGPHGGRRFEARASRQKTRVVHTGPRDSVRSGDQHRATRLLTLQIQAPRLEIDPTLPKREDERLLRPAFEHVLRDVHVVTGTDARVLNQWLDVTEEVRAQIEPRQINETHERCEVADVAS